MNLTIGQLKKACKGSGYIILTRENGLRVAINKGIARIAQRRFGDTKDKKKTNFVGWRDCSLNEYINNKIPFAI